MTEHWSFSIVLALLICFAIGWLAAVVDVLRRRYGNRRIDVAGGAMLILLLGYIALGTGFAVYMAFDSVVSTAGIEYDSREFLR